MSARIPTVTATTTPEASRPILEKLRASLGMVPNLYATVGHSPAALEGFLAFSHALGGGAITGREAELLALHLSELNGCAYCLSAHTLLAAKAGASPDEIAAARDGQAEARRQRAILALGRKVLRTGGARAGRELAEAREAGLTHGEVVEVLAHVAARVFTNAVAILAETEIDFPRAARLPTN